MGKEGERGRWAWDFWVLTPLPHLSKCLLFSQFPLNSFPSLSSSRRASPPSSSSSVAPLFSASDRPRRRFADLHGDIRVERVPLYLNLPVGQRADAVLLHRVLRVLYLIEPGGRETERNKRRIRSKSSEWKSDLDDVRNNILFDLHFHYSWEVHNITIKAFAEWLLTAKQTF